MTESCKKCYEQVKTFFNIIKAQNVLWHPYTVNYTADSTENPARHDDNITNAYFEYADYKINRHRFKEDTAAFIDIKKFQLPACKSFKDLKQAINMCDYRDWNPKVTSAANIYRFALSPILGTRNPQITYF